MDTAVALELRTADRIWIAVALLHQDFPRQVAFRKAEILRKLESEGLAAGIERGTINAHLDQHCVSNVPPSSGKYRMLLELAPGNLRLFRPGDLTHPSRIQRRKPSKSVPLSAEIPAKYWPLLAWYETWCRECKARNEPINWEDDPLIQLIGSGRNIWADEHADEYVNRLREEDPE